MFLTLKAVELQQIKLQPALLTDQLLDDADARVAAFQPLRITEVQSGCGGRSITPLIEYVFAQWMRQAVDSSVFNLGLFCQLALANELVVAGCDLGEGR